MKFLNNIFIIMLIVGCSTPKQETTTASSRTDSKPLIFQPSINNVNTPKLEEDNRFPLYTSTDFGKTWNALNTSIPQNANVSFIELFGDELIVATDNYGVFISQNSKTDWTTISNNLRSKKINVLHVSDHKIYVSAYGSGLYFTKDKGINWESINYNLGSLESQSVLMNDGKLLAGTDDGIYELQENTKTWTLLFPNVQVLSLFKHKNRLIAGTNLGTLLSPNNGKTWNWIHEEGAVHYTKLIDTTIVEMYIYNDVFISSNWGEDWTNADYIPREGSYVYEIEQVGNGLVMSNN